MIESLDMDARNLGCGSSASTVETDCGEKYNSAEKSIIPWNKVFSSEKKRLFRGGKYNSAEKSLILQRKV